MSKSEQSQTFKIPTIVEFNFTLLEELGVKHLLIDYDNTLSNIRNELITPKTLAFLKKLQHTFSVEIFSNSLVFAKRRKNYFETHKIRYTTAYKPWSGLIHTRKDAAIIGDKWLTDGLYAKLTKIPFVHVKSAEHGL